MPIIDFRIWAIIQHRDDGMLLAEALLFPEASCVGLAKKTVLRRLTRLVSQLLSELPPDEIYQRTSPEQVEVKAVSLEWPPPASNPAWTLPLQTTVHYICWKHSADAHLAFVPRLNIEVITQSPEHLASAVATQSLAALHRICAQPSLRDLLEYWAERELELEQVILPLDLPSAKQRAISDATEDDKPALDVKDIVEDLSIKLSSKPTTRAFEVDGQLRRLADLLLNPARPSVLLVGRPGVGKTAIFHELVTCRRKMGLGYLPFWSTSGAQIIAGRSGAGMWQERLECLVKSAAKSKAILHCGQLRELMEVGKCQGQPIGIAGHLRPYLVRGDVNVIAECTAEELPVIEREDPQLLEAFVQFRVEEPGPAESRTILQQYVTQQRARQPDLPACDTATLDELDRLHRRYASYSSYPGRPLRFLNSLLDDCVARHMTRISPSEVTRAFSRETGLPLILLDESIPFDAEKTRAWFSQRVMGQPDAVNLVVDLLAMVKTRLTRPGRPIASLLLIGPTGVGKTEMAKSLAEFMYQDPSRIVRFDMSEYADPMSVDRLIGGSFGTAGTLCKRVREMPFTVVLFDELEKADGSFFDLLLQILGDGRLTDSGGRVADFTNCFVIMTSNLGADTYGKGIYGFSAATAVDPAQDDPGEAEQMVEEATRHFSQKVREFFRPELFNRIDRIVPFAPLNRATILAVAKRELIELLRRDGLAQRNIHVDLPEDVIEFLAARGYEPQYGARPLKRAVQRWLVAPLAKELNRFPAREILRAQAEVQATTLSVRAVREEPPVAAAQRQHTSQNLTAMADRSSKLRRNAQRLVSSTAARRLRDTIYRHELAQQIARKASRRCQRRTPRDDLVLSQQFWEQKAFCERIAAHLSDCQRTEEETLLALFEDHEVDPTTLDARLSQLSDDFEDLLLRLFLTESRGGAALIVILGLNGLHDIWPVVQMALVYEMLTKDNQVFRFVLKPHAPRPTTPSYYLRHRTSSIDTETHVSTDVYRVPSFDQFAQSPPDDVVGLALCVMGKDAYPRYLAEAGRHEFVDQKNRKSSCLIEIHTGLMSAYAPPRMKAGVFQVDAALRRTYRVGDQRIIDKTLGVTAEWHGRPLHEVVGLLIERVFRRTLLRILT